jgi:hypothetical protein
MSLLRRHSTLRVAVAAGALFLFPSGRVLAGPITYLVTVNTSAINGTSGFLDFGFAPGNDSQNAFVTVSSFSSSGSLTGVPQVSGGVSGALPVAVTIDNSTQFNDYFQGFNYGTAITFLVTFGGPAVTSPNGTSTSGSTFGFGMFDGTGTNPLLTTDLNGNTFTVDVNLDGTTTITTFLSNSQGGAAVATVQPTPEPSAFVLVGLGLVAIALTHRRRSNPSSGAAGRAQTE